MKKIWTLLGTVMITTMVLAGCGSPKATEAVRVGSLKGPTTMGLVNLMKDSENGKAEGKYEFLMKTQPDEIMEQYKGAEKKWN